MRYGLALPTGGECGDPTFVVELAVLAEETGWNGVFLEDYICFQGDPRAPTCVGLGDTGEHVVGDASFSAFGEPRRPRVRAEMLDEALQVIAGLLGGEPFSFSGEHYRVDEVAFQPTPVQTPRVPIWVGGGYPHPGPTRRAQRWDGSCLYHAETHDLSAEHVRHLRAGASDRPFGICVGGRERRDGDKAWLTELATAGATWWAEYVPAQDRTTMRAAVSRGPLRID